MSNQINDGGPVFSLGPTASTMKPMQDGTLIVTHYGMERGISIRDYFAAAALPVAWNAYDSGYFGDTGHESTNHAVATAAYQMADAMLKAREAKP